jgi:hypothetical protein
MNLPFYLRLQYNLSLILEQLLGQKFFDARLRKWRVYLEKRIEQRFNSHPRDTSPIEIDRVHDISQEEFISQYLRKNRAVIFSGQAKDWACCQKWSFEYFSQTAGSENVLIVGAPGLTQPINQTEVDVEILKVKELVRDIQVGGEKYLRFSPLVEKNKSLAADLNFEWLTSMRGPRTFARTFYLFLGGKGRKTYLHSDQPCNLFVQVTGEKRWVLYDVEDAPLVYPVLTNSAYVNSAITNENFDHEKFPLFRYAKPLIAHLKPGDILYVPPYMWHQVENLTESIAVGYRFSSLRLAVSASLTFLFLRILATNPPIWKTGSLGKIDTNLIWAYTAGKLSEALGLKNK